ncbi:MAG TPA: GDP-mannose 4,6-dehydratase [Gemmatimonadaceae bacterium]|jgi:GDP-4-dehydro-6-deoxy-D-mannose reductase
MPQRVLITGGAGFVGQWLSRAMLERGATVFAGTLDGPPRAPTLAPNEMRAICWTPLDVTSDDSVRRAVETSAPDRVVHLAGIAFAPEANAAPIRAFEINALGAMRLLAALSPASGVRALIVGSAEEYGAQDSSAYPIAETAALRPLTPYAAAKAAQELVSLQACRSTGVEVICTRSFNHSGVGHGDSYLLPTLVRRARELPKIGGTLRIGNGKVIRDYLHVADVVDAYMLLLDRGQSGEVYNVCSGQGTTVRELAERVLKRVGLSADISSDSSLLRSIDVPILVGDNRKLHAITGWMPKRSIDDIIDDLIHAAPR